MLIVGNWKMNLTRAESLALAQELTRIIPEGPAEVAVCPPYVYLEAVRAALENSPIAWGAQNMSDQPNGALTGEISSDMLLDLGCRYVILGHSERRQLLGETSELVRSKTVRALEAGLIPIVCVGETLDERESGRTQAVVSQQFEKSLGGLTEDQMRRVVIAYEPVWAIGTGKVATPEQAEAVHSDLRRLVETHYNASVAAGLRIQYGGSVKPENAAELLRQPNIDGALVGGASLKAESFAGIVAAVPRD